MKTVVIEYTVRHDADVADVERHIGEFVAGIGALGEGIRYASHRKRGVERAYAHIGYIPDDGAQQRLQAAPFFKAFAEYLPTVTSESARVTWLEVVASTER